ATAVKALKRSVPNVARSFAAAEPTRGHRPPCRWAARRAAVETESAANAFDVARSVGARRRHRHGGRSLRRMTRYAAPRGHAGGRFSTKERKPSIASGERTEPTNIGMSNG